MDVVVVVVVNVVLNLMGKKRKRIYIVPLIVCILSKRSGMDQSFTCKLHYTMPAFPS